jgi:hypothetical protein
MIRAERISRILKLAQQDDFTNIGEDWDVEEEETSIQKNIQEQSKLNLDTENMVSTHKRWLKKYLGYDKDYDFIMENLKTLNSFYNHGKTEPKYLGSGSYGTAYLLGDGKVLKLMRTTHVRVKDKYDDPMKAVKDYYDLSSEMIFEKIPGAESEIMVFKQGLLFKDKKPELSWVIMEKVETNNENRDNLTMTIFNLKTLVNDYIKRIIGDIDENNPPLTIGNVKEYLTTEKIQQIKNITKDIKEHALKYSDYIKKADKEFSNNADIADDWLDKLIEQMIIKKLSGKWDFKAVNMGLRRTTGHFIFFDA